MKTKRNRKRINKNYHIRTREDKVASRKIWALVRAGKVEREDCECGAPDSNPWHADPKELMDYHWLCQVCRKVANQRIADEVNAMYKKFEDMDDFRNFRPQPFGGKRWNNE